MDLTVLVENTLLNIRVAVIIKTENGYILEKNKQAGHYFLVGGRIKVNETSEEAAKREVLEELGLSLQNIKLKAVIENFFGRKDQPVQEICFIYTTDFVSKIELPEGFGEYTIDEINQIDFKPTILKQVIESEGEEILHFSYKG